VADRSGFATAGQATVLLPSGYRVRGVIPGLDILAARGLLDARVLAAAMRLNDRGQLDTQPFTPKDEKDLQAYTDALVAGFPVEALDPGDETGEWKPTSLTIENVRTMDQRDRALLEDLVLHLKTPDEVTAAAQRALDAVDSEEGPSELDRMAEFRDERRGDAGAEYSGSVVSAALETARAAG
jgi:hypothetical protein